MCHILFQSNESVESNESVIGGNFSTRSFFLRHDDVDQTAVIRRQWCAAIRT